MLVIGLTGGIGSGKSTIADLFSKNGAGVIDTDKLSRELTDTGTPALKAITQHFGATLIKPDGDLDRTALRKRIFENPEERQWLEQLLHPLIRQAMYQQINESTAPYCIVVIPLLTEIGPDPVIQRILVVDATPAQQLERAQKRDQHSAGDLSAIIKAQSSREERLQLADDVIENTGHLDALATAVQSLHAMYMKLSGH